MTVQSIYIDGCIGTEFMYDSWEDFDVKHADIFICKLAGKIIDDLSKDGTVDIDIMYGNPDQFKLMDYTIEFFVNDKPRGFMSITVYFD